MMTNKALAKLLRNAASALEHGRHSTANKKLNLIVKEVYPEGVEALRHSAD